MENLTKLQSWVNEYLEKHQHSSKFHFDVILETPWSNIIRVTTSEGILYLKQTPPDLFIEPQVIQLLANQFHASVPTSLASNNQLHCFLMKDAGQTLRSYLKSNWQPELLSSAITQFTAMQRATEKHLDFFLDLGVPDWRLDKFPNLYLQLVNQTELLKSQGMTEDELKKLADLIPTLSQQCKLLSGYQIPETLVQVDFHTNNILINPHTKKLTWIDLGEVIITQPFFSLANYLSQAITHHDVKQYDPVYQQMQAACYENWLDLASQKQLQECFELINKILPIYSAFGFFRLMQSVDLAALKVYYAGRPNRLAADFKNYITANQRYLT